MKIAWQKLLVIIFWTLGWILLNLPEWGLRVGVYTAEEGNLWIPSLYGTAINALIFFGNANYLLPAFSRHRSLGRYFAYLFSLFIGLCLFESALDFILYPFLSSETFNDLWNEIFITNLLINGLFFLLPSFLYRFSKDWMVNSDEKTSKGSEVLKIKVNRTLFRIPFNEIMFLESEGNKLKIHYQGEVLIARESLANIMESLPPNKFVRTHKSFIVSRNFVDKVDYDYVYLPKKSIPIGRKYREMVNQFFSQD